MAEARRRRSVSAALLHQLLARQLADFGGDRELDVIDVGGGTGAWAIELAAQGHRVTVVDPSPDALASLERRTAEAGLRGPDRRPSRETPPTSATWSGRAWPTSWSATGCSRSSTRCRSRWPGWRRCSGPHGLLSLLVPQRAATVLAQALLGHIDQARRSYAADPLDHAAVLDAVRRRASRSGSCTGSERSPTTFPVR